MGPSIGELEFTGLHHSWPDGLSVQSRSGGETILISGHSQHKKIKHLFQELAVPPWLRQTIPLLWWGNEPAAVGDWYVSRHLQDYLTSHKASLIWRPRHPVLRYLHKTCSPEKIKMPDSVAGAG
jgi:tRNA(Ile)-lysidine synthetase-like protein